MEFNTDLFSKIITENDVDLGALDIEGYPKSVYDDIEAQEEIIYKNKDLYDMYNKINTILERPKAYEEIQSVAPSIDVNKGILVIKGACKHRNYDTCDTCPKLDNVAENDPVKMFIAELEEKLCPGLEIAGAEIGDDGQPDPAGKTYFNVVIARKG